MAIRKYKFGSLAVRHKVGSCFPAEHVDHPPITTERASSVASMAIEVAAELSDRTYEGPFDLLLQLILAEEVDLYEVNLAASSTPTWPRSSDSKPSISTSPPSSS